MSVGSVDNAAPNREFYRRDPARPPPTPMTAPHSALPEPRSTGFGTTLLDAMAPVEPAGPAAAAFDVCHVGVVLRTLLFVEGITALGVLFVAPDFTSALARTAAASAVALPGMLL